MLGLWQRFGEGEPPQDGEALVFVQFANEVESIFTGPRPEAEVAIHRHGALHLQHGGTIGIPYGCWWTSLPHFSARA